MDLHTTIRDSTPEDAAQIFDLRCDPRLAGMQYAPTSFETPTTIFTVARPGSEVPRTGHKCTTISVDQIFAGHITQLFTTDRNGVTNVYLGWNLVPELWGMGIKVRAGWISCPGCGRRFMPSDGSVFRGGFHLNCGQRINVIG